MNTNPNAKRILCFGDSNTWGYISNSDHRRLPSNKRWPGVLQNILGEEFEIIEEGLNSRTINSIDSRPGKNGRDAMSYILPCLDTHDPIDVAVLLVGTGELKYEFNKSADKVLEEILALKMIIETRKSQFRNSFSEVIIISPPSIDESKEYASKNNKYKDASSKSRKLEVLLKTITKSEFFIPTHDDIKVGEDGIHITEASHKILAEKVSEKVKALFSKSSN